MVNKYKTIPQMIDDINHLFGTDFKCIEFDNRRDSTFLIDYSKRTGCMFRIFIQSQEKFRYEYTKIMENENLRRYWFKNYTCLFYNVFSTENSPHNDIEMQFLFHIAIKLIYEDHIKFSDKYKEKIKDIANTYLFTSNADK